MYTQVIRGSCDTSFRLSRFREGTRFHISYLLPQVMLVHLVKGPDPEQQDPKVSLLKHKCPNVLVKHFNVTTNITVIEIETQILKEK